MPSEGLFNKDGAPKASALRKLRPSARLAEEERLQDELAEAKAGNDPERLNEAKVAMDRWRTFWREEREASGEQDPDVVAAQPETLRVKATSNSPKGA